MTDTQSVEAAVLVGAESAVGDLLARLRLSTGTHEVTTVLDWLDQHGVLDAVDHSAQHPAQVSGAASGASDAQAAAAVPAAATATAGAEGVAVEDAGQPSAPVHTQSVEPTASAAAAVADAEATEAAKNPKGAAPPTAPVDATRAQLKAGLVAGMRHVIDLLEQL